MRKNIDKRLTPKLALIYAGLVKLKKQRPHVINGGKVPDNEFKHLITLK